LAHISYHEPHKHHELVVSIILLFVYVREVRGRILFYSYCKSFPFLLYFMLTMPTYEYECKSCSHGFEVFQSMSDPPLKDCPKCGKEVRRLILGGSGVIFKGSGFYVTDKGKSDIKSVGGKPAAKPASSQKTESAPSGSGEKVDSSSKSPSASADSGSSGSGTSTPAESSKPESKSA